MIAFKNRSMKSKHLALVVAFAALAIGLNAIKIPAFFWPGNFLTLSDVPVVIAFLLFGVRVGLFVGFLNLLGQLAFFLINPAYLVAYPMGFVATLLMLFGVYLACRFIGIKDQRSWGDRKKIIYATAFSIAFRAGIMPFIDYKIFYGLLLPLFGYSIPESYVIGLMPVFIFFNLIVALYTIPIAFIVATQVRRSLKLQAVLLK
jgi:riboflavin transporter FmnP